METIESLKAKSQRYQNEHGRLGINWEHELIIANDAIERIERIREHEVPLLGDTIVCVGPKKTYPHGFLNKKLDEWCNCCVQPYIPFVNSTCSYDKDKKRPVSNSKTLSFSTSGGYWFTLNHDAELKFLGKEKRMFCIWGMNGMCGNGAIYFDAEVNKWEYHNKKIY